MRCGAAQTDITPERAVELCGFVARTQPSLGVHDRLGARALFVEEHGHRLLWLHSDLVAFERDDVRLLKRSLFGALGLGEHEIIVTATHTHSGPATCRLIECGEYDSDYVSELLVKLLALGEAAVRCARPAQAYFAEGSCDLGRDRRGGPYEHTDPRLPVIAWKGLDGTWLAVLAVYAVHCVAMGPENRLISSDILGRAARTVSSRLDGAPVVLFANGACGNTNPPGVGDDFERMEGWGDQVAAAAISALAHTRRLPDTVGPMRLSSIIAAPDALIDSQIDAVVAGKLKEGPKLIRAKERWKALMLEGGSRSEACIDVQTVTIGTITFAGVSGEVFSRFGDALGKTVYPVGYANGDAGYICPAETYDEGGYEPEVACVFYGTRPIPRGTFERVVDLTRGLTVNLAAAWRPEEF